MIALAILNLLAINLRVAAWLTALNAREAR